ncbi:MAG: WYL domain-containing protein [Clostridia bacterium]|nr:WYL domain-containing protein [Clostridia bacterium]
MAVSGQFFGWVFGLGKKAKIVAPESVREQMKEELAGIIEKYL